VNGRLTLCAEYVDYYLQTNREKIADFATANGTEKAAARYTRLLEETQMRSILFAMLIAASAGLAGLTTANAAPANGVPLGEAAQATSDVSTVQWRRRWHRRHWGPHCRMRCNSWGRCWRVCW